MSDFVQITALLTILGVVALGMNRVRMRIGQMQIDLDNKKSSHEGSSRSYDDKRT